MAQTITDFFMRACKQGEKMNRILVSLLCCLALLSFSNASLPLQAQTTSQVPAVPFYRFRVSDTNLGFLYTASFQEGTNAGFTPNGVNNDPNGIIGFIVVPPTPNSTPVDGQGLQPLYRWRVVEDGRLYYHITPWLGTNGSNYTLEGIVGYTFNLHDNTRPGLVLNAWYSQSYGYWYALIGERQPDASFDFSPFLPPPDNCQFLYTNPANGLRYCSTYRDHGSICKLLQNQGGSFTFTTPPPPPPPSPGPCNAGAGVRSKCAQLGGFWDDECCCCQY
jgi:hypothetical protein